MTLDRFHAATAEWFGRTFGEPTEVQARAWPAIGEGHHTLIAAPTGSGKTLAAFLSAIDGLVREGLERGLRDETRVLYVSPLKALSNDIHRNLEAPLAGVRDALLENRLPDVAVRSWVRTGDTPQAERERMRRQPPHILVTTPESLHILLTSESGRRMLSTVRSVIVDEIHSIAGTKRGAHLALSLARLDALTAAPPARIGLSATQKPIEAVADFLTGGEPCRIVDTGHVRDRDLALELPGSPLQAVMPAEVWSEIYDRLAELVREHRTTLIFVNTRRLAERLARHLAERLGEESVTAHHGSLSRKHRLRAEQALKSGELKALVATASLELGIDIGSVDLVCQLGSPRGISIFLQRVGRSGHAVGARPRGRLFPLSRDDLVECAALLEAVERGELDRIRFPGAPLDVLAQQIVSEVAAREWDEEGLFNLFRSAWPYRHLERARFTEVVVMLAQGFSTRRGRRGAYLHRDAVNGRLRGRRGARLTALMNGGVIPDQFDYDVVLMPEEAKVGTLNEDFAFESLPGDIFQLGNTSYRIQRVVQGKVYVEDARGQPPNLPFWIGEAPGRTDELTEAVCGLRGRFGERLESAGADAARRWLATLPGLTEPAVRQLGDYLAAGHAALGALPTADTVLLERFFDEAGDQHLVIHAAFGSRLNRAWGLALRKRFCRRFNFELQAAALEDTIVLSLGSTHSFALEEVSRYLHSASVREVLIQALLDAPMFGTHWRWNATTALAVKRMVNGRKRPPQFQRSDAEDLVAVIFPDQLACLENIAGQREVPEHPLVDQTIGDCLHGVMDIEGLEALLRRMEAGEVRVLTRDLSAPSPLAEEVLTARPYAFLDDAPAEERRTLAVRTGGPLDPIAAEGLGRLSAEAVERVRREAWPDARDHDELHDALVVLGCLGADEGPRAETGIGFGWDHLYDALVDEGRATRLTLPDGTVLRVAVERLAEWRAVHPAVAADPPLQPLTEPGAAATSREEALVELVRSRLEGCGPCTCADLAARLGVEADDIAGALTALETEGFVMQGRFSPGATDVEWCDRRLLARMHRYSIQRRRAAVETASPADYMRFLLAWHGVGGEQREGLEALAASLGQLEGFAVPAAAWESDILPARIADYLPGMLDQLVAAGHVAWARLPTTRGNGRRSTGPVRSTPVVLADRTALAAWRAYATQADTESLGSAAAQALEALQREGASFFTDLVAASGLLRTQLESALGELASAGLVTSDSFTGLRALIAPAHRRAGFSPRGRRRRTTSGVDAAGRWSLLPPVPGADEESLQTVAWTLLERYGVVFRQVLRRESGLPAWRDLLYTYRRLEARGEIQGGRFVSGFSGEQFALAEAAAALNDCRKRSNRGDLVSISAADPLNLTGIVTPGERLPALAGNRVLLRDGVPVAVSAGGDIRFLGDVDPATEWRLRNILLRRQNPAGYAGGTDAHA